jgi:L-amino acid N-acyltransferase YncA
MIRKAMASDLDPILDMGVDFWRETIFSEPYDRSCAKLMMDSCMEKDLLAVLEVDGKVEGFVAGVVGPVYANPNVMAGSEIAWWINSEHRNSGNGKALMKFMEQLAKKQGVKYWSMVSMESSDPEKANAMYAKAGYAKTETVWNKRI